MVIYSPHSIRKLPLQPDTIFARYQRRDRTASVIYRQHAMQHLAAGVQPNARSHCTVISPTTPPRPRAVPRRGNLHVDVCHTCFAALVFSSMRRLQRHISDSTVQHELPLLQVCSAWYQAVEIGHQRGPIGALHRPQPQPGGPAPTTFASLSPPPRFALSEPWLPRGSRGLGLGLLGGALPSSRREDS